MHFVQESRIRQAASAPGAAQYRIDETVRYAKGRKPFEHIHRHHRRYRITEGADEIQIRNIAGRLFGFLARRVPEETCT